MESLGIILGCVACLSCVCMFIYVAKDKILKFICDCDQITESFDQKDIDFATNIVNELNINNNLSYPGYLNLLTKYNNSSLNLISKSSYEKIIFNNKLTPSDILSLLY